MKVQKKEHGEWLRRASYVFLLFPAIGAQAPDSYFIAFDLGIARQLTDLQRANRRALDVFDLAALATHKMVMLGNVRIVANKPALVYFPHQPLSFEPVQGVIDRGPTDFWVVVCNIRIDRIGRWVRIGCG